MLDCWYMQSRLFEVLEGTPAAVADTISMQVLVVLR